MASLISYQEDSRHKLPARLVLRRTLEIAIITLAFLVLLSLTIGGALSAMLGPP